MKCSNVKHNKTKYAYMFCCLGWCSLLMSVISSWLVVVVVVSSATFLLILCLLDLSISEKCVVKSPTWYQIYLFLFDSLSVFASCARFIVRHIDIKEYYVFLEYWPLYHDMMPFLILDNFSYLEVYSLVKIGTSAF